MRMNRVVKHGGKPDVNYRLVLLVVQLPFVFPAREWVQVGGASLKNVPTVPKGCRALVVKS